MHIKLSIVLVLFIIITIIFFLSFYKYNITFVIAFLYFKISATLKFKKECKKFLRIVLNMKFFLFCFYPVKYNNDELNTIFLSILLNLTFFIKYK